MRLNRFSGFLVLFLLLGITLPVRSQILTESEVLSRMVENALSKGFRFTESGSYPLGKVCEGKSFYVDLSGGIIRDMRVELFPSEGRGNISPYVCHFIERYLLDLLLKKDRTERSNSLRADFVTLLADGQTYPVTGADIVDMVKVLQFTTPFRIESDTIAYRITWTPEAEIRTVQMTFPKHYDLILGKDKKELAHGFRKELESFSKTDIQAVITPSSHRLKEEKGILFEEQGFYVIPQMKSGRYLSESPNGYTYLRNERFAEETLLNLFSHGDEMHWEGLLNMEVKGYRLSDTFPYTIDRLASFMKEQQCDAYVGVETVTKEEITGTVIYVNQGLMYKHLGYFTFPRSAFKRMDHPVRLLIYPYIPIHNVNTLYEDEE